MEFTCHCRIFSVEMVLYSITCYLLEARLFWIQCSVMIRCFFSISERNMVLVPATTIKCFFSFQFNVSMDQLNDSHLFHDFAKADYDQISLTLSQVWNDSYAVSSPDVLWTNFLTVLNKVCSKYIPVCKSVSKCNHNKNYPKSISNKLKEKH
jgi:hypothetical protein